MPSCSATTEKILFISFDNDFFLHTEGNIVAIKYNLLNDLFYELGSELVFLAKSELSTDKAALITDFRVDRPTEFESFSKNLLRTITAKLFGANIDSETTIIIDLPESYIEWLKYNSNTEYNAIGKRIFSSSEHSVHIGMDDLVEYVEKFLNSDVRRAIESDSSIKGFTLEPTSNQLSKLAEVVRSFRNDLIFFPYSDAHIQCKLGLAYYNGVGVEKNIEKCIPFLLNAMEMGDAEATNKIGYLYQTGKGIPKDEAKAIQCYKQAGDQGFVRGYANLGYCLHHGIGTPIDYVQAVSYYLKGAEVGITFAQANLANIYYEGLLGQPNYEEAFKWYMEVAKGNNSYEQYKAGKMLCEGKGTSIDVPRGLDLLKKSALGGNTDATLFYAREVSKTSNLSAIREAFDLLKNCESNKRYTERNPEIFFIQGELLYNFLSDDPDDAIQELKYAQNLKYEPATKLLEEIERTEEEKRRVVEQRFSNKMENLMKKAVYSSEEERFLEGQVDEEALEGCSCYPPKEWEKQFITKDKYGVEYNHQYHRLVSAKRSIFNWHLQVLNDDTRMMASINHIMNEFHGIKDDYLDETHYAVEEGTEIICRGAFEYCGMQTLSLPNTLKQIGDLPGKLTSLTIPLSVEEIYVDALGRKKSPKTITILNGNIRVVWENYDGREELSPQNENNWVYDDLFNRCDGLDKIYIPAGTRKRFSSMFPSVKDKLEEIPDPEASSSTKGNKREVKVPTTVSSHTQNESKSITTPNRRASGTTERKSTQSKKPKDVTTPIEDKTSSKREESGEIKPTRKTNHNMSKNAGTTKSGIRKKATQTKRITETEKKDRSSSNINNTQEKQSFFSKLKNFFK